MIWIAVILPLLGALLAWVIPDNRLRPVVLPAFALPHLVLTFVLISITPPASPHGWIFLDALGKLVLITVSILFTMCAFYALGYLRYRIEFSNRILCMALLVCLSAMTLVTVSQHLGLLWVALETTTVTMAPLIYFNRNARSIEATWKYLLICSVGIAIALFGLFFLAYTRDLSIIDRMLANMFGTSGDGLSDRLLHFVTPVGGGYFFVPSEPMLHRLAT